MRVSDRFRHAWNAFRNRDPTRIINETPSSYNQAMPQRLYSSTRTILSTLKNRIAIDCAAIAIRHVRIDQNGRYMEDINSPLNKCLTISPNLDQTPRAFIQDVVLSMLDEGYVAVFPAKGDTDLDETMNFQIKELRIGRIVEWYPSYVKIDAYNPDTGRRQDIIMEKKQVAIIENPLYATMNGVNSTINRLANKLNALDLIDSKNASNKLDLIIQLPYMVQSDLRRQQAEERRKEIEFQLTQSQYGIAYMGATERVTQLNRPVENNLLAQVEYFTNRLYSDLGITAAVFEGTADEAQMLNYNNKTIEPIVAAIADEMKRKFLTSTARTRGQTIMYFRDPFKLVPVAQIAEIADKFTRNEILSSNEVRAIMGFRPSSDPKADELRNSNIAASKQEMEEKIAPDDNTDDEPPQE